MTALRRAAMALVAVLVAVSAAGCGVPEDDSTRTIDPDRVPYDLLGGEPTQTPPAAPGTSVLAAVSPQVYFLDADARPSPLPQALTEAAGAGATVDALLARLAAGPTEPERAAGLSSALGPGVRLGLLDVVDRVARIAVVPSEQPPTADRLPLAMAQLVFTVTSVQGIDRMQLVRNGRTIEVPLPGGARTSEPVGAGDYLRLLTGPAAVP
jgi:spore germination protein GerM